MMLLILFLISLLALPVQAAEKNPFWQLAKVKVNAFFNVSAHQLSGEAQIELPPRQVVWINVQNLALKNVLLASKRLTPEIENGAFRVMATSPGQVLKIRFTARFVRGKNLLSSKGIVLTENWCPSVKGLAFYDLRVVVPKRFKAVAPADKISVKRRRTAYYHFIFPHPSGPPPLIAGRYFYFEKKRHGLTISVYLLENDPKLARLYQDKALAFIRKYSKLFGPYPYKRFAVVENIFETGYAFPTMTLLGRAVLRLPFIPDTSLRHEILHNWFGNGVYVDWDRGNWSEGLVTYLADHQRAEEHHEGASYRHQLLVNYQSYVSFEKAFPLKDFRGRYDRASQAIGYAKGAMFFHMLRRELGDKVFFKGLRTFYEKYLFQTASWEDLEHTFEGVCQRDLSEFFKQWLNRAGLPELFLYRERVIRLKKEKYLVGLTVTQREPYYRLRVPLVVVSDKETKHLEVELSGPRTRVDVKISGHPKEARLDPDYDVARHLSESEFPPVISRLLGAKQGLVILTRKREINIYRPLISFLREHHFTLETDPIDPESILRPIVYLGEVPPKLRPLFGEMKGGDFCLEIQENPIDPDLIIARAKAQEAREIEAVLRKLPHLGRYQMICSQKGQITHKKEAIYERGIKVLLSGETRGIALHSLEPLEAIARAVSLSKIIFLGEEHDRYEHHLAQLAVIKWLHQNRHKIAIGMEMFQRPFQQVLDDYLAGRIDELEFLKRSQYFKRWGYNWRMYKPILDYAREEKIPVVALNIPQEITDKVAKKGLKALSAEERAQLPQIDFENLAYKEYLRWVYKNHPEQKKEIKDFECFYQAQLLWDEGMAETIASYLKEHPDYQMVVLVGKAHVMYGYGIPSRVARRGYDSYSIVLLGGEESLEPGMADYVLFPKPKAPPFFAHLGVLVEEGFGGLKIEKVFPHEPAAKAGLRKGDVIIEADGLPIRNVADLKLILYQKKPEDKVRLRLKRGGFLKTVVVGPFKAPQKPF